MISAIRTIGGELEFIRDFTETHKDLDIDIEGEDVYFRKYNINIHLREPLSARTYESFERHRCLAIYTSEGFAYHFYRIYQIHLEDDLLAFSSLDVNIRIMRDEEIEEFAQRCRRRKGE